MVVFRQPSDFSAKFNHFRFFPLPDCVANFDPESGRILKVRGISADD
jgi:hypothetical protein